MATLPPTHTLTQMPKNLTLVVATPKRIGALPVVIIINCLALNGLKGAKFIPQRLTTIFVMETTFAKETTFLNFLVIHTHIGYTVYSNTCPKQTSASQTISFDRFLSRKIKLKTSKQIENIPHSQHFLPEGWDALEGIPSNVHCLRCQLM